MNLVVCNWRLTSRLVLSLTLFVSNFSQLALLVTSNSGATALAANQSAASSDDRRKLEQTEDKNSSRPRRIETKHEAQSGPGPLIRVALVTDVLTVALSSSFGFRVRSDQTSLSQSKSVPGTSMTVELRQLSEPVDREPAIAVYRVSVGSSHDSRRAQKLADELKKRFFEPVTMSYDQKTEEYTVLIGKFKSRSEASLFHDRLRKSGFDDLRVLNDASGQLSDANSRDKYRAQPTSTGRSSVKSDRRLSKLVAVSADRITATSERELVIAPALSLRPLDQNEDSSHESGTSSRPVTTKDHDPVRDLRARTDVTPVMKMGKSEYRGEIKLILNSRGRINVVNELPLEDYLRGVVPLELSPGIYPEIEALKAQAIAARSYALTRMGRNRDEGYDLVDDTRAQVYGGISAERALTNRAIDETRGIAVVFVDDDGNLAPIEALYTANCGGRTENNEEVFGGKAAPYLRGVSCSPDRQTPASGNIISSRTRDSMFGVTGRSLAKEVAILSVLGFSLPNRVSSNYLSRVPERDELRSWLQQTVRFTQKTMPSAIRGDGIRLIEFARLIASCIYGEGRAKTLLSPADVDYILEGLPVQSVPLDARPDLALLLKDGILNLPGGFMDARETITRGQAIETLARAISSHHKPALKSSPSILNSPTTDPLANVPNLVSDIALPTQSGRLVISTPGSASSNSREDGRLSNSGNGARESGASPRNQSAKATPSTTREPSRRGQQTTLEISEDVWLFRNLGGQSYQVDRLNIIGGERAVYHLNAKGKVDFLEASTSDRSAASDRFSSVAQWQERISAEDLQQRLMRAGVDVGRLEGIEPVSFSSSNRVNELEITGEDGRARLRRSQIRSLGLKEYLFVVDRETDERGRTVAFVFTGRGWGHGVGMCQTGAYGLAREGYSHTAILQRYYTGVKLRKLY